MHRGTDSDTSLVRSVEGGPESFAGEFDRVQDALARNEGGNRYAALHDTFGPRDDDSDPLEGWDSTNIAEMLRCTVGPAEEFAAEYEQMTPEEREQKFPNPLVAELVATWAKSGSSMI